MYNKIIRVILVALLTLPFVGNAQNSSINTFSPYTFYGLGDISTPATAASASMGSIGVAMWSPYSINLLNPASYGSMMRKTFLFNFGMSGKSNYLKTNNAKSADNSFNISDIAVQFPIYKGIGFGFSVTPFSTVGYRAERVETNQDIIADIGHVKYKYNGEGGISQFKAGLGFQVYKGLSLGVDFVYYMGTITRQYRQVITPMVAAQSYGNISVRSQEEISKTSVNFGAQYDVIKNPKRILTLGATYQPKTNLYNKVTKEIASTTSQDSIYNKSIRQPMDIPQRIAGGVFYRTEKFGAGLDYTLQDWKNAFTLPQEDNVTLSKLQSFNLGVQYTPNRLDIRNRFKRWTYRAGLRYTDMYMVKNGHQTNDMAITMGIGAPLRMGSFSEVNVGLELGRRGKTSFGLIRENYFKVSIGLSLFGEDQWFVKHKYY